MTIKFIRWLNRRGVKRSAMRGTLAHRILGERLFSQDLWRFNRSSVAKGWLVGSLAAFNPFLGFQIAMGLPLTLLFRANFFVVLALIFTTNPITIGPFLVFCYWIGALLTGETGTFNEGWQDMTFMEFLKEGSLALGIGCAVFTLVVGLTGFLLIHLLWKERAKPQGGSGTGTERGSEPPPPDATVVPGEASGSREARAAAERSTVARL